MQVVDGGIVDVLAQLASRPSLEMRTQCAGLLANLCASTEAALPLLDNGSTAAALAQLLRGPESKLMRAATLATANCCTAAWHASPCAASQMFFANVAKGGLIELLSRYALHAARHARSDLTCARGDSCLTHASRDVSGHTLRAMIHLTKDGMRARGRASSSSLTRAHAEALALRMIDLQVPRSAARILTDSTAPQQLSMYSCVLLAR